MTVRRATEADIPRLLGYAQRFLDYHPITSQVPRDLAAVEAVLRKLLTADDGVLLVTDHGVVGGMINPMWCAPDVRVALELFWWADKGGLSLMRAFHKWATESGANIIQVAMIVGRKDVSTIYDRMGFMPVELSFVRAA